MTKAKGSFTTKKHRKILRMARGYRGARSRQYRRAKEAVLHAGQYAYAGRRLRRRDLRSLWIVKLNAALAPYGISYSRFMYLLQKSKLPLNRKLLSQLALEEPEVFKSLVEKIIKK